MKIPLAKNTSFIASKPLLKPLKRIIHYQLSIIHYQLYFNGF